MDRTKKIFYALAFNKMTTKKHTIRLIRTFCWFTKLWVNHLFCWVEKFCHTEKKEAEHTPKWPNTHTNTILRAENRASTNNATPDVLTIVSLQVKYFCISRVVCSKINGFNTHFNRSKSTYTQALHENSKCMQFTARGYTILLNEFIISLWISWLCRIFKRRAITLQILQILRILRILWIFHIQIMSHSIIRTRCFFLFWYKLL